MWVTRVNALGSSGTGVRIDTVLAPFAAATSNWAETGLVRDFK